MGIVAESNTFKAGDVVISSRYGTRMTVQRVQNNNVECAWFVGTKCFWELFLDSEVSLESE